MCHFRRRYMFEANPTVDSPAWLSLHICIQPQQNGIQTRRTILNRKICIWSCQDNIDPMDMYYITQNKIYAECRDTLPRPRLVCQEQWPAEMKCIWQNQPVKIHSGIYGTELVQLPDEMDDISMNRKFSVYEPSDCRVFRIHRPFYCISTPNLDRFHECWN